MGREIRRVPKQWEHPKKSDGSYFPMFNRNYQEEADQWVKSFLKFEEKKRSGHKEEYYNFYWEYDSPPDEEYCVPYTKEEATWYQVYETVSEGTPVTPPFETEQELIDYLVNNGTFWDNKKYDRKVAERFVLETQWVPSGIFANGKFLLGIDACLIKEENEQSNGTT